jgi:hypothetical protein
MEDAYVFPAQGIHISLELYRNNDNPIGIEAVTELFTSVGLWAAASTITTTRKREIVSHYFKRNWPRTQQILTSSPNLFPRCNNISTSL